MLLYLSLWLVKALWLTVTPALLCCNRRCADSRSQLNITHFEFNLGSFFICGENESKPTPKKPPRRDQKAAKNCFGYDSRSHPLPLGFEPTTTVLNAEWPIHSATSPPHTYVCIYNHIYKLNNIQKNMYGWMDVCTYPWMNALKFPYMRINVCKNRWMDVYIYIYLHRNE